MAIWDAGRVFVSTSAISPPSWHSHLVSVTPIESHSLFSSTSSPRVGTRRQKSKWKKCRTVFGAEDKMSAVVLAVGIECDSSCEVSVSLGKAIIVILILSPSLSNWCGIGGTWGKRPIWVGRDGGHYGIWFYYTRMRHAAHAYRKDKRWVRKFGHGLSYRLGGEISLRLLFAFFFRA